MPLFCLYAKNGYFYPIVKQIKYKTMKKQQSVFVASEKKQQRVSGRFAKIKVIHVLHVSPLMTGKKLIRWMDKHNDIINPKTKSNA